MSMAKLKKDLLSELLNYKSTIYKNLTEEEINHLYTKLTNKLSVINTFYNGLNIYDWENKLRKTNIFFNLIAQNSIYEKIYIYTNNLDDKYSWLKNKFKDDVFIFINEINFDKINE